jgi:hypothetical protein
LGFHPSHCDGGSGSGRRLVGDHAHGVLGGPFVVDSSPETNNGLAYAGGLVYFGPICDELSVRSGVEVAPVEPSCLEGLFCVSPGPVLVLEVIIGDAKPGVGGTQQVCSVLCRAHCLCASLLLGRCGIL